MTTEPLQLEPQLPAGAGDFTGHLDPSIALLRSVLDAVPARALVLDRDERLLYANHEFFAFTKLHPKQVLGQTIARIIGPAAYAAYVPVREQLKRGETVSWEGWVELAGAGRRYMRELLVPIKTPDTVIGEPPRTTVVMSLDITALKLREAELSAKVHELETTEALKSAIVDHALAAIVSTDAEGHIVEFNPAAEAMFGRSREACLGRPVHEVMIPPRYQNAHREGMARQMRGESPRVMGRRLEMHAQRADGSEFPVEMVLWSTEVAGSRFFTASLFDLTERHNNEREIERQREALRQSEKLSAMGSLLAGVAHELNNPLAIVMGRASLLEDKLEGTTHAADAGRLRDLAADAGRIRDAADRCGRIVRTFLNMARSRPAQRSSVVLNELVTAAVEMLQYGLRSHSIELRLALDDSLPPVKADGDQVGQVVLNLLVNAQHALSGAELPRVLEISSGLQPATASHEPMVWLRVHDNGRGVPDDLREKIFEPFFTTKPEGTGTGLGLAVSRSIAREHGGDLTLDAQASGALFLLRLPLSGEATVRTVPMPLATAEPARAARILVVDDEAEIADLMRAFLETAGYEVLTAESGAVALELLAETEVDAIVSDLRMPDIDGAALWREVRQREPLLARRMLFVTGDTLSPGAQRFLDDAGCTSLDKPFAKKDLLERVKDLLDA